MIINVNRVPQPIAVRLEKPMPLVPPDHTANRLAKPLGSKPSRFLLNASPAGYKNKFHVDSGAQESHGIGMVNLATPRVARV